MRLWISTALPPPVASWRILSKPKVSLSGPSKAVTDEMSRSVSFLGSDADYLVFFQLAHCPSWETDRGVFWH